MYLEDFANLVVGNDWYPAWQAALAAMPFGGRLNIGPGYHRFSQPLNPGDEPLTLQGEGWGTRVCAVRNDPQWAAPNAIDATVLAFSGTDGLQITSANYNGLEVRDLAILGNGAVCTNGVNYLQSSAVRNDFANVLIANFDTGVRFNNALGNRVEKLCVFGCSTGLLFDQVITDSHFYRVEVQQCGTGIKAISGSLVKFWGVLVQACQTGIALIGPPNGGLDVWEFDGVWFEGSQASFVLDATNGPMKHIKLSTSRFSDAGNQIQFVGAWNIAGVTFQTLYAGGVVLNVPQNVYDLTMLGRCEFAQVNDPYSKVQDFGALHF